MTGTAHTTAPTARSGAGIDVVVIGAGPVGLTLALLLARQGRRVEVLERREQPYGLPRAVHLDHEAARILQGVGVMAALEGRTETMDAYEWRNAAGSTLLRLGIPGELGLSGWPPSTMFSQPDLEDALEAAVDACPLAGIRRGWTVTGLTDHPYEGGDTGEADTDESDTGGVRVVGVGPDGAPAALEARWAVGCDGASSTVRDLIDAPVIDLGASSPWLVVDIVAARDRTWRPLNIQSCDPARPTTAVSGGPGRRRFEFMQLPDDGDADLERTDTVWRLLEPWGYGSADTTIERHATYTFAARMVERWRRGRVLLAGDAAHQMPPFAGQGLCSGLRDAANLAWKLDLVVAGAAPAEILDTYGTERAPQVRTEIAFSVDLGSIICVLDPAEAAARDQAMIAAAATSGPVAIPAAPPLGPGIARPGDPHAGELGLQAVVGHRDRVGRFDDVVGRGWMLLAGGIHPAASLPAPLATWWHSIGGQSWQVGEGGPVDDRDGRYGPWLAGLDAPAVLVRPDFHLVGAGRPADLVDALRGLLASCAAAPT